MPREASELERALGRLLTAIQSEETRAINSSEWAPTHAILGRAEGLYWAAKHRTLGQALGAESPRSYLGLAWLARHPRVLPAIQELELQMQDFKRQA
jgi:hypothetical protein